MKRFVFIAFALIFAFSYVDAQEDADAYTEKIRIVEFNYGQYLPFADLADRFGRYNSIGSSVGLLYANNVQLELRGNILYGRNVKEDVLRPLRNEEGVVTGADGIDAILFLRMRGANVSMQLNKIIPRNKETRSGVKLGLGAGLLWHKIRLQDDSRSVAQLLEDYEYGYDRLSAGLSLNQFVGYQILAKNQTLNFIFGLDVVESFTKNIRPFNFSGTDEFHNASRLDIAVGLKVGFMMTFYKFDKPEEIFY